MHFNLNAWLEENAFSHEQATMVNIRVSLLIV